MQRSEVLILATSYTYWLSQFAVVGLTLLWVYFRHHDRFADFRNWLIGANLVGLLGYVLMPTAPPRMFPEWGFTDTLAEYASVNHDSGLIAFAANPYAAMPSLHAMDALIVGDRDGLRLPFAASPGALAAWPAWVCFSVMGTGNHYWLDCVAGFAVALLVAALLLFRRRLPRVLAAPRERTGRRRAGRSSCRRASARHERSFPARPRQAGVHRRRAGDPAALDAGCRTDEADARHAHPRRASPCASRARCWSASRPATSTCSSGSAACCSSSGSIADILDGALARAASKGTVFGAFLDSTFDRLGEAAMLAAIGLSFMHDSNEVALVAAFRGGDRLVPRLVHARQGGGARPARRRRLRLPRRAGRAHLGRARARALGLAAVADLRAGGARLAHRRCSGSCSCAGSCASSPSRPPCASRARPEGRLEARQRRRRGRLLLALCLLAHQQRPASSSGCQLP